jgi:hypothetical protein
MKPGLPARHPGQNLLKAYAWRALGKLKSTPAQ